MDIGIIKIVKKLFLNKINAFLGQRNLESTKSAHEATQGSHPYGHA